MNNSRIAIVGVGLRYPDATSPGELWENVLAGRNAFRLPSGELTPGRHHAAELADATADALTDAGLPRHTTGLPIASGDPAIAPLLSVLLAAKELADGDLDVAIAGGGPPGSCGVVVLMREADALARHRRIYASITGWGESDAGERNDDESAHRLALTRAHERAQYGVATVAYVEGHDTGAAVDALAALRRAAEPVAPAAALGTLAGNLGHTTATGMAALIKAALAVHHQTIPPGTGATSEPAPATDAPVYVPDDAALWPTRLPVRAGVSATGSGGAACHVALEEAPGRERRTGISRWAAALVTGRQDTDLLLVDSDFADELAARLARLARLAARLSTAEITDLAGTLAIKQRGGAFRAAVVAGDPATTTQRLAAAAAAASEHTTPLSPADGVFLAHRTTTPRIAYLLPGNGASHGARGALRRRFILAEHLFGMAGRDQGADALVVAGSLAGLRVLHALGVEADVAVGHGVGELTALSWSGALDGGELMHLARGGDRAEVVFRAPRKPAVSTTGDEVDPHRTPGRPEPMCLRGKALDVIEGADLAIEVGPGRALAASAARAAPDTPVLALDTDSSSLAPLLSAVGAAYALGVAIDPTPLFADRVIRPITEED